MHELQDHGAANERSGLEVRAFTQWPDVGRVDKHGDRLSRWFTPKVLDEFQPVLLACRMVENDRPEFMVCQRGGVANEGKGFRAG